MDQQINLGYLMEELQVASLNTMTGMRKMVLSFLGHATASSQ